MLLGCVPEHIKPYNWFVSGRSTRNKVSLPKAKSTQFTRSPFFQGYCAWLQLPDSVKTSASLIGLGG